MFGLKNRSKQGSWQNLFSHVKPNSPPRKKDSDCWARSRINENGFIPPTCPNLPNEGSGHFFLELTPLTYQISVMPTSRAPEIRATWDTFLTWCPDSHFGVGHPLTRCLIPLWNNLRIYNFTFRHTVTVFLILHATVKCKISSNCIVLSTPWKKCLLDMIGEELRHTHCSWLVCPSDLVKAILRRSVLLYTHKGTHGTVYTDMYRGHLLK